MSRDEGLSEKLAEALAGRHHDSLAEMIDRCANAAEMGVRIAFLSKADPLEVASRIAKRPGATLIEQRSPKGKLRSASVRFAKGGEVLFTHSRMRAKTFGASEIVTPEED